MTLFKMGLPALTLIAPEDYLQFEKLAQYRHEFYEGQILAMAGGSRSHATIQVNLIQGFANRFRDNKRPCRPYGSDTRVYVDRLKYFYPDVSIFCGQPNIDAENNWRNPEAVIEILSDSTASFDRNEKADAYKQMESLKELFLIDSRKKAITTYRKRQDGAWLEQEIEFSAAPIEIAGEVFSFEEIYADAL